MKYASTVARAHLGPLELGLKYDVSEVVLETLLHAEACRVVCSCLFKFFIPPYATLTSREHTVQKANEGPFLDTLAHLKLLLSGRKVQAYLALFGVGSCLSLLLSLLSS